MADILMVEDDLEFYDMVAGFLRHQGHRLALAVDPAQLYTVMEGFSPDLVILDLQIPGGGAPFAQKVLDNARGAGMPVLICSGMPVRYQREWFPESPLRRYMAKPVNLRELGNRVAELLLIGSQAVGHA